MSQKEDENSVYLPFSDLIGRTFNFFGGEGGLGPLLGVNGVLGTENPRVPAALTAATRNRYQRPGFSRLRIDTFVLMKRTQ